MCTLLTQMLYLMCNTQILALENNKIGDVGMQAFSTALAGGAMAKCTYLGLERNQIGDDGISAFAQAIKPVSDGGSGALPQLKGLWLHKEAPALKAACKARGITFH